MSLRSVRFDDHWRKALLREYPVRLEKLTFSGLRCVRDGSIEFARGVTAIVGGNGVGKSTLAQATADVLTGIEGLKALQEHSVRLLGSELRAQVVGVSGGSELRVAVAAEGKRQSNGVELEGEFVWLDPSDLAMRCQQQIMGDNEFDDLLESVGPRKLIADELAAASYVVGKVYSECTVWEIQEYGDFAILPYFRVASNGVAYGSEDMGRGELALMIALWVLSRLPDNTVLVLEEPENHISARSQDALMNLLARACALKGLWVILTTHSPVIVRRLPRSHIRLLANTGGKSVLIANPHEHQVASILGGGVAYGNLLLTEDECGKVLALALCDLLDEDLRHQITVVAAGGDSKIDGALRALPRPERWSSKIVGIYDGDARGKAKTDLNWPHVFLPGLVSPEELLQTCLSSDRGIEEIAKILGIDVERVHVAMDAATGLDHHDWHEVLACNLGPDKLTVTRALARIWVANNKEDGQKFVDQLRIAIG